MKVLEQEHTGLPIFTWHTELGPHGDGLHGDLGIGGSANYE